MFLEAYHCRMGRYSNMNPCSRAATENFVFLKAANNGSLKTNCCFESKARWNALAKKLACLKAGKRLLWSLACWTNFFFIFTNGGCTCFYEEKAKIFARTTRANHKTAAPLKIYLLFAQKHGLHLTQLIWSHFFRSMAKMHKFFPSATRPL